MGLQLTSSLAQFAFLLGIGVVVLLGGYHVGSNSGDDASGAAQEQAFDDPRGVPADNAVVGSSADPAFLAPTLPADISLDIIQRLKQALEREEGRPISSLSSETLADHQKTAAELRAAVTVALQAVEARVSTEHYSRVKRALILLASMDAVVDGALQAALPVAAKRMASSGRSSVESAILKKQDGAPQRGTWKVSVTVNEKPFGMHVRRGTATVEEVFANSLAQKSGVRPGCEISEINSMEVHPGTWLEAFQMVSVPFVMRFTCGKSLVDKLAGTGPLSEDEGRYRVMVVKRPYGLNVQVNVVPRVVEVLPGFPAEAAGVRRGFVLTEVNDQPVNVSTWFEKYHTATLPFTLTFNTKVALHAGNPFFLNDFDGKLAETAKGNFSQSVGFAVAAENDGGIIANTPEGNPLSDETYMDFQTSADRLPYGMQVSAAQRHWPRVVSVTAGLPAEKAGVKVGDVVVEVAGRPVTSTNWFAAMQQAVTPYGLRFRRPRKGAVDTSVSNTFVAAPPLSVDERRFRVMVVKRPFGLNVQVNVVPRVVEVLAGYPAAASGVRRGFVLTEVNDVPVDTKTWFEKYQTAPLPFTLTFDTKVALHAGNPFFANGTDGRLAASNPASADLGLAIPAASEAELIVNTPEGDPLSGDFEDFETKASQLPFGMEVSAAPRHWPRVVNVPANMPAAGAGVRVGDVLVEVASKAVTSTSWFGAMREATLPYALKFRRPRKGADAQANNFAVQAPLSEEPGQFRINVLKRPFGLNVQVNVVPRVVEVLPGYPAAASGVRPGFVLTKVNDEAVDAKTWFEKFHTAPLPFTLTFDTKVPIHVGNPFFKNGTDGKLSVVLAGDDSNAVAVPSSNEALVNTPDGDPLSAGFEDFQTKATELPFGMEVSAAPRHWPRVVNVPVGMPAEKAGVRVGDVLVEVAGLPVNYSSWFGAIRQTAPPYDLKFRRPMKGAADASIKSFAVTGPLIQEEGRFKIMVLKRPFGLNVQVNVVPRVVEVLAGYPAEASGVRPGFVLTKVNDESVDTRNWFEKYHTAPLPFTLTFDTKVPLHVGNPFFINGTDGKLSKASTAPSADAIGGAAADSKPELLVNTPEGDPLSEDFEDFQTDADQLPFGMEVSAAPRHWPRVVNVPVGMPAEKAGVRIGDVLLEVAGKPVTSTTWFGAMRQGATPYKLKFRRPRKGPKTSANNFAVAAPLSEDKGSYRIQVLKRPFGLNVQVNVVPRVVEVLKGFPAEASGVRRGYVLTEVNGEPVDKDTWFDKYQTAPLPFTITFNTTVPVHEGNAFFANGADGKLSDVPTVVPETKGFFGAAEVLPNTQEGDPLSDAFVDFQIKAEQLPFGMHVKAVPKNWPRVSKIVAGLPAERAGVRVGDVLIEVAGHQVTSETVFAATQQAAVPYDLKFRRPLKASSNATS